MDPRAAKSSSSPATAPEGKPVRVGDLLLQAGTINQEQIEQALAYQREQGHTMLLGEVLVHLKHVSQEQVMEVIAGAHGVPFVHVNPKLVDPKVIDVLPKDFVDKQCVLPLFVIEDKLTIAVHELSDVFLIEEIERLSGCQVQLVAATAKDIRQTLGTYVSNENVFVIDEVLEDFEQDLTLVERRVTDVSDMEAAAGDSPVIKLVNYLIFAAVQDRASDIHIEPGDGTLRVRYRVDGRLFEKLRPPHQLHAAVVSRIKIMAGLDIAERRQPQDGGITVMVHKQPVDLRVSTIPGKLGEKVVMRVIDNRMMLVKLEKLGFAPELLENWRSIINRPNGVVLVTGPTGSGKSTTLYATLNEISDDSVNICTVEDPVENTLRGINQFQVHEKAGFTFASALRSLMRQDPDIIMVGEIRDQDTAKIATQAALTGHLVLSTLHTNDAPSAVTRLYNIGVEPYLVAAAIRGVLAQRLIRRICKDCKEKVKITPTQRRWLNKMTGEGKPVRTLYQGQGCSSCRQTGYAGRVGIYELFIPDEEVLEAISNGANLQALRRQLQERGHRTLAVDGLEKVREGITTIEEMAHATAMM